MRGKTFLFCLACVCLLMGMVPRAGGNEIPTWLPRYSLDIDLDVNQHEVRVSQKVTFTNRHKRPVTELVFNAHAHYEIAPEDVGLAAKTLELLRVDPSENLDFGGPPLQVHKVTFNDEELSFHYRDDIKTALVVPLPAAVPTNGSVTIHIQFSLRLPQRQGRWGQWKGITFLANWLPVLAVHDEEGWHPVPFIPWHQPFYNEAGVYEARVTVPEEEVVASSAPILNSRRLSNGLKQIDLAPHCARDFALLCSPHYCG